MISTKAASRPTSTRVNTSADNADKALAAFKAKKDKDVAALVQTMAMDADFAGLDKVREAAPDVFDVKYFPSDFVSEIGRAHV